MPDAVSASSLPIYPGLEQFMLDCIAPWLDYLKQQLNGCKNEQCRNISHNHYRDSKTDTRQTREMCSRIDMQAHAGRM